MRNEPVPEGLSNRWFLFGVLIRVADTSGRQPGEATQRTPFFSSPHGLLWDEVRLVLVGTRMPRAERRLLQE